MLRLLFILLFISLYTFPKEKSQISQAIYDNKFKGVQHALLFEGTRFFWASISMNTGTPAVTTQTGYWITSLGDTDPGKVRIHMRPGLCSVYPNCGTIGNDDGSMVDSVVALFTTEYVEVWPLNDASTVVDKNFFINCYCEF